MFIALCVRQCIHLFNAFCHAGVASRAARSAVLLLLGVVQAAHAIDHAVERVIAEGRHLTGDIGGALRVSILTAGLGPSLNGPGNSFEQTQDFRVSWDAED